MVKRKFEMIPQTSGDWGINNRARRLYDRLEAAFKRRLSGPVPPFSLWMWVPTSIHNGWFMVPDGRGTGAHQMVIIPPDHIIAQRVHHRKTQWDYMHTLLRTFGLRNISERHWFAERTGRVQFIQKRWFMGILYRRWREAYNLLRRVLPREIVMKMRPYIGEYSRLRRGREINVDGMSPLEGTPWETPLTH